MNLSMKYKLLVKNYEFQLSRNRKKTHLYFSFEKSTKLFVFDFEYTVIDSLSFKCCTKTLIQR